MARLLLVLLLFSSSLFAADPDEAFAAACKKFETGAYAEARNDFLAIIDRGNISADVCYNLGTVEYALDRPGRAALWYQRALVMNPMHREAAQNLRFLEKNKAVRTLPFYSWISPTVATSCRDIGLWTLVCAVLWIVWIRHKNWRIWPAVVAISVSVIVVALAAAGLLLRRDIVGPTAIKVVVGNEISVLSAPAEASEPVIKMTPGAQVLPLEERGAWTYLELAGENKTRGWVRNEYLEPLWPYPEHLVKN